MKKSTKTKAEPKPRGRPPEPVPADKAEEIINWISQGKTLREWCRQNDIHYSTVYLWMEKDESFNQRFARARDIGHDAIADEAMNILDEEPEMAVSEGGARRDAGYVAWQKARAEFRLKLLAKWNPKKYGDKMNVEHQGGINLSVVTGVPDDSDS